MNERRISLTRILAVNWYGFRQIIELSNDTLISGSFGTGKSALLDLIQYVMLGEHWRPNRAAAGNARGRSMVSYCLCDTNTTRDGEPHYTRSSGATLIGVEFSWPLEKGADEPRRETWGMRLEYSSPTAEPKRTYFLVPERVEWAALAPGGRMLEEEAFRTWLRREYGREFLFARQQDYLAEMATPHHLYFDLEQFQKTFPKAIAFEPEDNFEKFIREFILEENPLDVRDVKVAVGAYRDTQARLDKQEDEAAFLRRIAAQHAIYEQSRRQEVILAHTHHTLRHAQAGERLEKHQHALESLRAEQAADLKGLDQAVAELDQIRKVIEETRLEASRDPDQVKLDALTRKKESLEMEVQALRDMAKSVQERLDDRYFHWTQWLKHGGSLQLEGLEEILVIDDAVLARLRSNPDLDRLAALQALASRFNEMFMAVDQLLGPVREEVRQAENRLRQLGQDLDALNQKRMPGSFPLFEALQARLGNRAEQLGRLIEVKPEAERWWPALELFLGRNRWSVVVRKEDYREGLEVLRRTPPGRESESLVNPFEALQLGSTVRDNSLATKVEVADEIARAYAHSLLGDVICVETVEDLDRCGARRAITPEGIFKQTPTRRRLRPAQEVFLTLGREGIKRMQQAKERDLVETRAARDAAEQRLRDIHHWLDAGKKAGLGEAALPERALELHRLPSLERELGVTRETMQLLATPEREARLRKLAEHEALKGRLDGKVAVLKERMNSFVIRARPHEEGVASAEEELEAARLAMIESRLQLPPGILDKELEAVGRSLMDEFDSWSARLEAARIGEARAHEEAVNARHARHNERRALIEARDAEGNLRHPEYRSDFPLEDESNESWSVRLRLLDETELPRFRLLAAERRKDWEKRLQESVLDRLNERIRDAERTVKQLRDYLDRDIGKHRYRITQRRDPAYALLWQLLDSGFEPADQLLQASRSEEVQAALRQLMEAVEAADQADERAQRMLDYRHYHRYDLEMILANRPDAPTISLGRSGRNLSGGESQAPFFISMLAAFHRVYDLGPSRAQHLGLVAMDEAFSKLSGDGVEDCLELARNFQLQLVLAFPPEKLGVMAPYADTVVMCRKLEQRDAAGYVTRIDNIPILLTPQQVRESLE